MSTTVNNNVTYLGLGDVIDGRLFIDLVDTACKWATVAKKTHFTFYGCTLDTAALSNNLLKPLKGYLSILRSFQRVLSFKEVCWNSVDKAKLSSLIKAVQHSFATVSGFSGGACYLIASKVVHLSPHFRILNLTKHITSTANNVLKIALDASNMWELYQQGSENSQSNKWRWCDHILSIWNQTLSIVSTIFIRLAPEFGFALFAATQLSPFTLAAISTCENIGKIAQAVACKWSGLA